MNSLAIWCEQINVEGEIGNLHVDSNLWLTTEKDDNYLELGLRLENFNNIKKIFVYIPYVIEKSEIEDKVSFLANSPQLTNALFNEKLSISTTHGSYSLVSSPDSTPKFYYYSINIKEGITVTHHEDGETKGTIIAIDYTDESKPKTNCIYSRLRINTLDVLYQESFKNYMFIDGYLEKHSTIEFNLNNIRKLPKTIVDKLENHIKINSLHLFLMTNTTFEITLKTKDMHASRVLENHIWDDYLKNNSQKRSIDKVIAYHWKEKDVISEYSLFIKTVRNKRSWWMLVGTLVAIILLGSIAGVGGNYLTKYIENKCYTVSADNNESNKTIGEANATKHK